MYKTSQTLHLENLILTLAGGLEFASNSYCLARMGKTHFHPEPRNQAHFFLMFLKLVNLGKLFKLPRTCTVKSSLENWRIWSSLENLIGSCAHFTEHRAQSLIIVNYLLSLPFMPLPLSACHIVIFIAERCWLTLQMSKMTMSNTWLIFLPGTSLPYPVINIMV